MNTPLAERLRPREMSDVVGQDHILGEKGPLKRLLSSGKLTNMIFYGPSGVVKPPLPIWWRLWQGFPFAS